MAEMAMQVVSEKLSNEKLELQIEELQKQVRNLTKKLKRTSAQIADKDEELLELRTENARLTDRLKRARASGQKNNENKWKYEAKKKKDGPMGGASGRQKKVARPAEVTDGTD